MESVPDSTRLLKETRRTLARGHWVRWGARESQEAVGDCLLALGWEAVDLEAPMPMPGRPRSRIDLAAFGPGGIILALEVDRVTPRIKSLAKLSRARTQWIAHTAVLLRTPGGHSAHVARWLEPP